MTRGEIISIRDQIKSQLVWTAKAAIKQGKHGANPDKTPHDRKAHAIVLRSRRMARDRARQEKLRRDVESRKRRHVMDSAGWKGGAVEAGQSFKKRKTTGPNMGDVLSADDPTGMGLDGFFQPTSGTLSVCNADSNLEHGNDSGNTDGRPGSSTDVPSFHLPANDSSRTVTICDISGDHGGY